MGGEGRIANISQDFPGGKEYRVTQHIKYLCRHQNPRLSKYCVEMLATLANLPFYIHGSVQRESNLITVQQDAIYSVYYISVGSSTCFRC